MIFLGHICFCVPGVTSVTALILLTYFGHTRFRAGVPGVPVDFAYRILTVSATQLQDVNFWVFPFTLSRVTRSHFCPGAAGELGGQKWRIPAVPTFPSGEFGAPERHKITPKPKTQVLEIG